MPFKDEDSAAHGAVIEVHTGNREWGRRTRIPQDGLAVQDVKRHMRQRQRLRQRSRAFYDAAAAVVVQQGVAVRTAFRPSDDLVLDHGSDPVRAVPAIAGFDEGMTQTPGKSVTGLIRRLLATLARP